MVNVFSIPAFFIVLREVLEACLVVGIVLAYLDKTGAVHLRKWVWSGAGAGVLVSSVIGITFTVFYYTRDDQVFSGPAELIFEGFAFLFAAGLLTWMILWMLKAGKSLQADIEKKVDTAIEADSAGMAAWGVFGMVFIQVLREGIETFIFLFGAAASGEADDGTVDKEAWKSVILPGFLGLIVGLAVAFFVFRGLVTLDIQSFFMISSIVLMAFAAGLVSHGLHELQEVDWFGPYEKKNGVEIGSIERDWWNAKMWNTSACCNDKKNEFFAMLRALFGYQDTPSFIEFASYFFYWFVVLGVLAGLYWGAVRAARNKTARYAKTCSGFAFLSMFVGAIYVCLNFTWSGCLVTFAGVIIATVATAASFDAISSNFGAIAAARRSLALGAAVAIALYTLFVSVLHIVQLSCLDKSCELPQFFYWGLIFSNDWNVRGNTGSSWNAVAVLSISFVFSVFFLTFWTVVMYLYSSHVSNSGEYVYEDRVKLGDHSDEEGAFASETASAISGEVEIPRRQEGVML